MDERLFDSTGAERLSGTEAEMFDTSYDGPSSGKTAGYADSVIVSYWPLCILLIHSLQPLLMVMEMMVCLSLHLEVQH